MNGINDYAKEIKTEKVIKIIERAREKGKISPEDTLEIIEDILRESQRNPWKTP